MKLAERPARTLAATEPASAPPGTRPNQDPVLGLTVRDLDAGAFNRFQLPRQTRGVLITRVEPLSASFDADVERGIVLLEINRKPIQIGGGLPPPGARTPAPATSSRSISTRPNCSSGS